MSLTCKTKDRKFYSSFQSQLDLVKNDQLVRIQAGKGRYIEFKDQLENIYLHHVL